MSLNVINEASESSQLLKFFKENLTYSNSNIYSINEEIEIGKWIDNKTIFRKCIEFENQYPDDSLVHNLGIDTYVDVKLLYTEDRYPDIKLFSPGGESNDNTFLISLGNSQDSNKIDELFSGAGYQTSGVAIIEYTKLISNSTPEPQ